MAPYKWGVSAGYLKYFRYGPFEWLWRSLSYNKIQAFKNK